MKLTIVWLAAAVMAAPVYAQSVYATGKLANGLTYHIFKVPSAGARLVTRLNIGVGAADENAGEEGIAHITEHMVFQSSPENPQGLSNRLNREGWQMGRHYNAQTTYDYTRYLLTPPQGVRQLESALQVYRQIMQPKRFSPADWQQEQQVIINEWRQQQSLQNRLSRRQHELLYQGARQGRYAPIGRLNAIENADMDTASAFHKRWYVGNNAVLVVVGNVSIDATAALVQKHFGDLPAGALAERKAEEYEPPLRDGWHIGQIQDNDNADSKLSMVFRFKKQPTQAYEEQTYQRLLDNFAAYIVNLRIKQSGQDVVLKMNTLGRNTGALIFHSDIAPNQHSEMLEVLQSLRQDILSKPATNEELAAYRKALHNNLLPQNAQIPNDLAKVVSLSDDMLQGLPLPDAGIQAADRSQLYRISAKAVNERIAAWLNAPDKMIQVQAAASETVQLPELGRLNTPARKKADAPEAEAAPKFAEAVGGSIVAERKDAKLNIRYLTLSNGDTAVVMKLPMAGKNLYFKAVSPMGYLSGDGQTNQAARSPWLHKLTADFAERTAPAGVNANQFRQWQQKARIDKYSHQLHADHQITDAQAVQTALPQLLQSYHFHQTQKLAGDWQGVVKRELSRYQVGKTAKSGRQRELWEQLQYGRSLMPSENGAYQRLTLPVLQSAWQQITAGPVQYYTVSNLPDEEVNAQISRYLAGIPRAAIKPMPLNLQAGRQYREAAINDTDGTEIHAAAWQNTPLLAPEQYEQIKLLNNLANARLKEALRSQNSAYGVHYQAVPDYSGRRVMAELKLNVAPEQAEAALETARKVLQNLPSEVGFSEARQLGKLFVEQENLRRRKPDLWLERLAVSHQNYGDARYLTSMQDVADSFSRGKLRATAKLMWSAENEQVLLMKPRQAKQ